MCECVKVSVECMCVWVNVSVCGVKLAWQGPEMVLGERIEALAEGQYFLLLQQPQRVFLSRGVTVCQVE